LRRIVANDSNTANAQTGFNFQFQRFYNDVMVNGETVTLFLDMQGNGWSYYGNRSELDEQTMSKLKANISKEQALEQIWKNVEYDLQYTTYGGGYTSPTTYEQPVVKLVYNPSYKDKSMFVKALDATDGTWKSIWPQDAAAMQTEQRATDIEGHWAQKDLETMLQYQILTVDSTGKLNPDQTIAYGEWLAMMAQAVSPYYKSYYSSNVGEDAKLFADVDKKSPNFEAIRFFVQMKWLASDANKKLDAGRDLTREDLAVSLVQLVKYNKLSRLLEPAISEMLPFTDRSKITNKSDVALAVALGLMQGTDGTFRPQEKITKAEAATVIIRLVKLQGKLDQPIGQ